MVAVGRHNSRKCQVPACMLFAHYNVASGTKKIHPCDRHRHEQHCTRVPIDSYSNSTGPLQCFKVQLFAQVIDWTELLYFIID